MKFARALPAVLLVIAVGCGGNTPTTASDQTSTAAPTVLSTAKATTKPSSTSGGKPAASAIAAATPRTTAAASSAALSAAVLRRTLLTQSELPSSGWKSVPSSSDEKSTADDFKPCGKDTTEKYKAVHDAKAEYNKGQLGDQLQLANESHVSVAHAVASMKEARDQIAACPKWSEKQSDGTTVTFTVTPAPFPKLGDETAAYRFKVTFSGKQGGVPYTVKGDGLAVGVRLGQNIVSVFHMALALNKEPKLDTAQTESITRKAVDKFRRTA